MPLYDCDPHSEAPEDRHSARAADGGDRCVPLWQDSPDLGEFGSRINGDSKRANAAEARFESRVEGIRQVKLIDTTPIGIMSAPLLPHTPTCMTNCGKSLPAPRIQKTGFQGRGLLLQYRKTALPGVRRYGEH